jgi:two-component system, chemotaxis family, sensor kinase Cph1
MNEFTEFLKGIFDTSLWPRRWACGEWSDFHGWLYIISDFLIGLAYTGIPIVIAIYIVKKDKYVQFRMVFWLFFAFILLCGLTHFMDATIFWWPAYRLSAVIRFATAIVSLGTLFALYKLMPEVLNLRTSAEFQTELLQRIKAEEELIKKNDEISRLNKILETRMYFLGLDNRLRGQGRLFQQQFLRIYRQITRRA